jgi:TPR repeat protein
MGLVMNKLSIVSLATVATAALALTGCGRAAFGGPQTHYDQAACVENALRNDPPQDMLEPAASRFTGGCVDGEAESCSALGVMNELGLAMPVDASRAVALYRKACDRDSARGCVNLGKALADGRGVAKDERRAEALFASACAKDEMFGCAELGKLKIARASAPTSIEGRTGRVLLARACDADERSACRAYGEVVASIDPREALVFFTKGCLQGDAHACKRMDAPRTETAGDAAAAWRSK